MTKKPMIGISMANIDNEVGMRQAILAVNYIEAIQQAGGIPYLIPSCLTDLSDIMPLLAGIVLTGGNDIDPSHYGETPSPALMPGDPERDRTEIQLLKLAMENQLPILGICRGMQLINVLLGGSLIQDLPTELGPKGAQHRIPPKMAHHHMVTVDVGSPLAHIFNETHMSIVSWHHQAIKRLADGLVPCAYAEDGIIEAVVMPEYPAWLVAVQWHPEALLANYPLQKKLFTAFITAAYSHI
jgi:putative glutamine amidotransferase